MEEAEKDPVLDSIGSSLSEIKAIASQTTEVLSNFENRMQLIEKAVMPVRNATLELTTAEHNIDLTIQGMDQIMSHFDVAFGGFIERDLTPTRLRSQPEVFFRALQRVRDSMEFLKRTSYRTTDDANKSLTRIYNQSIDQCTDEFRRILVTQRRLPLKSAVSKSLHNLSKILEESGRETYLVTYKEFRKESLRIVLRELYASPEIQCPNDGARYERGSHEYIQVLNHTLKLLQDEHKCVCEVLPLTPSTSEAYSFVAEVVLAFLENAAEHIMKSSKHTSPFHRVFVLFDIVDYFHSVIDDFRVALEVEKSNTALISKISRLLSQFESLSLQFLVDVESEVRNSSTSGREMPANGTVHPMTSSVMAYVKRLPEFQQVIERVLSNPPQEGSHPRALPRNLSAVIGGILRALEESLVKKGPHYSDRALMHIFLLNNFSYIKRHIQDSPETINIIGADGMRQLENSIAQSRRNYQSETWDKLLEPIIDDGSPLRYKNERSGELTNECREQIKDKFARFNSTLERLCELQSNYAVPDPHLREQLLQTTATSISPMYRAFREKYDKVTFTKKHPWKYLKYSPEEVDQKLRGLFHRSGVERTLEEKPEFV